MKINTYEIITLHKNLEVTTENKIVSEDDIDWVCQQIEEENNDTVESVAYHFVNTLYTI